MAVGTLLLASCGTDLYMEQAEPAKINLGRGSRVCVTSNYTRYSPELVNEVERRLLNSGYYTISNAPAFANAVMYLNLDVYRDRNYDTHDHDKKYDKKHDKDHKNYDSDRYNVRLDLRAVWQDGSVIGLGSYSDFFYGRDNFPANSLARNIAADVVPHMGSYSVNIDTSSEKPVLEQAAQACKAGNWNQGESLARQYVDQTGDPEGYFLLGVIARKSGNENKAVNYFQKAASMSPGTGKYVREMERGGELRARQQLMDAQTRG